MTHSFDLRARARQAMIDAGFTPEIPSAVLREVAALTEDAASDAEAAIQDARALLWSSINNVESRDLDQVEFAEQLPDGAIRLLIGIADVDAFVPKGSQIDLWASEQTTSVYTGVETFPMLPERLCTDLTSLRQGEDRGSVVTDVLIGADGESRGESVYQAVLHNRARLDYNSVGDWLAGHGPMPSANDPSLAAQIRLQERASRHLQTWRRKTGALEFETIEASPIVQDGAVTGLTVKAKNEARSLIENFMVAANSAIAALLSESGFPSLQRVVRTPARWAQIVELAVSLGDTLPAEPSALALSTFLARRKAAEQERFGDLSLSVVKLLGPGEYTVVGAGKEPEGHFGLAVHGYTHSTAPNRRYADLVTQRLLKAAIQGKPAPYSEAELDAIARHCNERATAARKVERVMRKVAAALFLGGHVGETFDALVTGASPKGVYARLLSPPAEGRIVRGERGLDVGDKVRVRLLNVDPAHGFIILAQREC